MKKVALFIDFDNIYSGLHRVAPQAADAFATDPASWLRWLETGMPVDEAPVDLEPRRILVRRCYLNPRVYQKFRAYFVLAGFDVVDCPPLTQQGKTSADIRMAMDVLDTLGHQTSFDEFVILSGDADFTPVLLRLRAHDRRTVILAVGFAAQAYKAACDLVINEGTFIETALGISGEEQPGPLDFDEDGEVPRSVPTLNEGTAPPLPLDIIARDVAQAAARGPVPSADLPSIYRRQPAFRASNDWLGFGSLRAMTEAVVARRSDLSMSPGNPWMISLRTDSARSAGVRPPPRFDDGASGRASAPYAPSPLRSARVSPTPVPASQPVPGMLERLARRVSQVTGAPLLPPTTYAAVFRAAAEYLSTNEFNLYSASKEVVKLTAVQGVEVSRTSVVFILRGIAYGGADLGRAPASYSAQDLAQSFRDNLSTLCADRGLVLSETESHALDRWLVKRLDTPPSAPPGSAPVPTPPIPTPMSGIVPEPGETEPA